MDITAASAPSKGKKPRFLVITVLLFAAFFLLMISVVGLIHLNREKISRVIVEEINQYLTIPVDVGSIHLGFWKHFPYISLDFNDIETNETPLVPGQPKLLKADHLYLKMHPLDLVRKNYRIRKILIEQATLNLFFFSDGSDNFHVIKTPEGDTKSEIDIKLDAVGLRAVAFSFRDLATDQDYKLFLNRLDIKGRLYEDQFDASLTGKIEVVMLRTGKDIILENRPAEVSTSLQVDTQSGRLLLRSGKIHTSAMSLRVEGMIQPGDKSDSLDLMVYTGSTSMAGIIELLPEESRSLAEIHKISGNLSYNLNIKGLIGAGMFPSIIAEWQIEQGACLVCPSSRLWIKNLNANGKYDNRYSPALDKQWLDISTISFSMGGHPVKASLKLDGLDAPRAEGRVQATIDLEKTLGCAAERFPFTLAGISDLEGTFGFKLETGWKISGTWSEALHIDAKGALRSGQLSYPDAALKWKNLTGAIRLRDGNLLVQDVEASTPEGKVGLDIRVENFLPWLEDKQNKAYADISLSAAALPLEQWFSGNNASLESDFSMGNIEADIRVKIEKVAYRNFRANQLEGDVNYSKAGLIARDLSFQTMGGSMKLKGAMIPYSEGQRINCVAQLYNINITELFRQMDNFGQEEITHKHLSGIMTADVELGLDLDKEYYPKEPTIKALANVSVSDGLVKDYEPLKGLARFIKAGNLDKVSIAPMQNQIYVRDNRVFIPEMTVNTDAINLTVSGTHFFNQEIDYSFQILMSELLGRKAREAKKENTEFGVIQDDGLGKTTLFIRMTGTSDKPVFSYDRRGLMQKVGKNLETEKKEIKQVLREEFHWLRQDSLKREKRRAEKRLIKDQEKGEFIFDWEENRY